MIYRAVHHCFSRFDNSVVTCEKKESQFIQSQQSDYTDDGGGQYRAGRGQMNQVKGGSWNDFVLGLVWAARALGSRLASGETTGGSDAAAPAIMALARHQWTMR